jgi:hypothetical protein
MAHSVEKSSLNLFVEKKRKTFVYPTDNNHLKKESKMYFQDFRFHPIVVEDQE